MLVVPDNLISEIIAHTEEEAPKEVCGWLAGKGNRVVRAYPVPNAAENPDHTFRMKPEAQLATVFEIREAGLGLTATYHSHPRTPAEPSARDLALAAYPDSFHIIVSLANGRPKIRCYRITDKGYRPVALLVEHAYRGRGTPRCS
jgi:proteasome lid subunit RPN8/RPN11